MEQNIIHLILTPSKALRHAAAWYQRDYQQLSLPDKMHRLQQMMAGCSAYPKGIPKTIAEVVLKMLALKQCSLSVLVI